MNASANWGNLFPQEYVPTILQDVLTCSQNLIRPSPSTKRSEDALTEQVYRRLCKLPLYRCGPPEPHFDSWLSDLENRPDLRFSCGQGIETYFLVEAKRLYVTFPKGRKDSLIGKYINEGMMRFVARKYAPFQTSSAMLAYVYDEMVPKTQQVVAKHIEKNAGKLCLCKNFDSSVNTINLPVHETHHDLKDKKFILYHLFTKV